MVAASVVVAVVVAVVVVVAVEVGCVVAWASTCLEQYGTQQGVHVIRTDRPCRSTGLHA